MNKILILTTEGCEACEIAQRNVDIAVSQVSKEIQVEKKDGVRSILFVKPKGHIEKSYTKVNLQNLQKRVR